MNNDYYTHREFLEKELSSFNPNKRINCLEFGTGDGSALIFNKFAKENSNINIQSYETDRDWLNITANKYGLSNYIFNHVDSWDQLLKEENFPDTYDLIFIDQAPWEARIKTLDVLLNKTKIAILHDYDYFNKGIIDDIYNVGPNSFFNKYISKKTLLTGNSNVLPPTLVITNL